MQTLMMKLFHDKPPRPKQESTRTQILTMEIGNDEHQNTKTPKRDDAN
jgi:hypothetical protein